MFWLLPVDAGTCSSQYAVDANARLPPCIIIVTILRLRSSLSPSCQYTLSEVDSQEVKTDLRKHNGGSYMLCHIRDGNTNLIHITVQAANRMGGARYAVLNINQPLFECLKGYFVLFNLLFDQALLKVQGTTLQLGKVEGATKVLTWSETWEEGDSDEVCPETPSPGNGAFG
ncbi:hypothetical protein EDB83DRAFT_2313509 [Lactarius deliciosus]|nr:hypothetical protein EDB83DRAFT_2313509 [Lactarius deliciosus]